MMAGLFGSALGYTRGDHVKLQAMLDAMTLGVVVHQAGIEIVDFQTADLSKSHMSGPMWSSGTSIVERDASKAVLVGLRISTAHIEPTPT
jgi:hypothetical protein